MFGPWLSKHLNTLRLFYERPNSSPDPLRLHFAAKTNTYTKVIYLEYKLKFFTALAQIKSRDYNELFAFLEKQMKINCRVDIQSLSNLAFL